MTAKVRRPTLLLVLVTLLLITSVLYWYDQYLTDIQSRLKGRVTQIVDALQLIPSMNSEQVSKLVTFPDFTRHGNKIGLLWPPNFEQVLFYFALPILLVVCGLISEWVINRKKA